MIDLSFLTDAEQEAILKVLHRDAELKKSEEERIRQLHDETEDENELKYKSGQWFYEAKSKRHRDKIHGADLVRASIRKRKSPATIELYGIMEPPDETEEDLKPSMTESNQSVKKVSFDSPNTDKDIMKNGTASPAKQRKNPFNAEGVVGETVLDNGVPDQSPEAGQVNGQEGKKNIMSSIYKYGVKLPYPAPIGGRQTSPEAEDDPPPQRPPVPKPRTLVLNGQPPDRSNSSVQREDSFNGTNKPKGILKRRSSSSSTDSESIRIPQNGEPIKLVLPSSPILEAEQTHLSDNQVTSSENSPDRQKQVRFSENVLQKPPTPNPETYSALEFGEFGILDHGAYQNELNFEFVDHPPYEESKPTQYSHSDVDHVNSTEVLGQNSLKENPSVSLTIQTPSNSAPILDAEKKLEDPSQGVNHNGEYEILDESYPETNIDSAGPEPLYAAVKKPSKSTSSNQEKDFDLDDALMEPRFLGQRGKIENAYQSEKPLEFGKSYGGAGKINYGSPSQPGKVYVSTNEDVLTPEMASNEQSSYRDFVDDPTLKTRVDDPKLKIRDSDYFPKWRRPNSFENEDLLSQPRAVQEFPKVNYGEQADTFVKPDPENRTNSTYSPGKYKIDTRYKSMFLRNTPEVEGGQVTQSSNLPVAQNMPFSSTPESESFQTREMFLLENRERKELPKSANFKVMSLKERIHDMPREQMANPSQFQSLKHFWNVEDKNPSKGDVDTSPSRMLKDVLKRNKPVQADRKQRNSAEIPAHDLSLPSSFDSLSEEEQTSHKVASWLAQTPTVYVAEQVDANEDQVHPGEDVMENIEKTQVDRNDQAEEFSSALQKLAEEALEAPKIAATERPKRETVQISPIEERGSMDWKKTSPAILVSSAEKKRPASGFYDRVVHISSTKPPAKETKIVADTPAISSKQYPREEVKEDVERREAPAKTADEFKIGFQKLMEEYQSTSNKSDDEHQEEEPNLPSKEQQLIETEEIIDKSSIPKGYEQQEFISALKKLEVEASKSPIIQDQDEQPETVSTLNMVSPMKSSFKIGSEHLAPVKLIETEEIIDKSSTPKGYEQQEFISALKKLEVEASKSPIIEDQDEQPETVSTLNMVSPMKSSFKIGSEHSAPVELIETEENIEKSSTPKGNDNQEFISALKKLEVEASTTPITVDQYEEPKTVSTGSPVKSSFKIGSEHLAPVKLIETEENIERSSTPKGYEQQEFISALKKLEVEASKSPIIEDQDEQPETVSTLNTVNPMKSSFKIGFEHLAPVELIETEENIEKSSTPKGYDNQEFISALKKLEVEASASPIIEDEYEEPKTVSTLNTVSPMKSSFKIGFEHFTPVEDDSMESPQKRNVTYTVKSSPPNDKDTNEIEEVVERTTEPSRIDETDFSAALRKLEHEAAIDEPSTEVEDTYEKSKMTPTLQSTRSIYTVQNMPTPSFSVENTSDLEEPYPYRAGNSAGADDTYVISKRERPKYTLEKLPVEEEPIEKTISDAKENSADYLKQIMRLEEEAAASAPEEPVDLSYGETFHVSQAPTKEVLISKKVYSSQESMPTELPSSAMPKDLSQPQLYAYKELANSPQSPSDLSGSFTGSAENVLYKKPDSTTEVSKSKKGMDISNPVLRALNRSAAKTLNAKAVQEVSPTSTNESKPNNQEEDTLAPIENSFPENAEKFKRMSQSVPTFLQDDTDGRETDSASESSFQIGRHKKSPSSLTNLSGSSGMASMSSVSGSIMSVYSGDFGNLDIKGGIEFSIDYVEQLKEFHIYIYQCKELAAADVKKQRSDPYVKAYLLPEKAKMGKRKTAVKKKSLNPVYNEILRYKIPKQSLEAQTLNLSVWHHDALGRNSFLGEVNLNLASWDWNNTQRNWYQLEPRTPASGVGLENRGEMKLSLKYLPVSAPEVGKKQHTTGEVHIWIRECIQLPMLRENKINSFVKCTILPDTSRKSRQKTRAVDKTPSPIFNHTMVYDGFKEEDLREACVELTVWDHNKLSNHFLGGLRIGLGTGKSYGTAVDWMDASHEESIMWEKMIATPNTWIDGLLPLRMFRMAKLAK